MTGVRINGSLSILVTSSAILHRIGLIFFQNVHLNLLYLNVLVVTNSLQYKIMKSKDSYLSRTNTEEGFSGFKRCSEKRSERLAP